MELLKKYHEYFFRKERELIIQNVIASEGEKRGVLTTDEWLIVKENKSEIFVGSSSECLVREKGIQIN